MQRFLLATLAALAVASVTPRASAWCRTTTNDAFVPTSAKPCDTEGTPLFWSSQCVGFSVQKDASVQVDLATAERLAGEAFAEWSRHDCFVDTDSCTGAREGKPTIAGQNLGPVSCGNVEHNQQGRSNANVIAFRDGDWPHEGTALALTTVTYRKDTGEIYDADVEVQSNPAEVKLSLDEGPIAAGYDLKSILVHEVGHVFGLAHTRSVTSTMYASYRPGQTFMRDLADDDVCGICAAYPPSRAGTCDPSPRGGLADACGGNDDSGCAFGKRPSREATPALAIACAVVFTAVFGRRLRRA